MLRCHGVDAANGRNNVVLLAVVAHAQNLLLHCARRVLDKACDLEVRESQTFSLTQDVGRKVLNLAVFAQYFGVVDNVFQFLDEPNVDFRQFLDALRCVAFFERFRDSEDAHIGRVAQLLVKVVELKVVIADKSVHSLTNHTKALLHNLLERFADRHYLAHRFH